VRLDDQPRGGAQQLVYADGFFVAAAPALDDPPFGQLPYDVVAYAADGRVAAESRIPTSFLYLDWKRVETQLRAYRLAHGCGTAVVWRCRSR
jgi:hypothetical protein